MSAKRAAGSSTSGPFKRPRRGVIGAATQADDTARLIASHHEAEHRGGGLSYLSTRSVGTAGRLRSLADVALQVSAEGILETLKLPHRATSASASVSSVGWDKERDLSGTVEATELREYIKSLPPALADKLMRAVVNLSAEAINSSNDGGGISVLALATLFLHSNTTTLSLSSLSAPQLLISRIPACTNLVELDLSTLITLGDQPLAKVLPSLTLLEKINLRGCTKVGDASVIALSKATESRLKVANLSLTAVTIKALISLLARCSALEVLKLANISGLNERAVMKLVDEATKAAVGWRHFPLSNLRTLKLRATEITEAALGRLLALCALSLTRLDISYTAVKSLDIVSTALHTAPEWKLEKLVASGLPLTPATLKGFFGPLSERSEVQRSRFHTLKLGAIPSTSTKAPGLTDTVLAGILPQLESLGGLESVSFFHNWDLGKRSEPMSRFIAVIGRRCKTLDLTIPIQDHHLEGFLPPLAEDEASSEPAATSPRLQTLILDTSKITDGAAGPISECRDLRQLHVAETRITTEFLTTVIAACPLLNKLNLTSCRGVPVTQRRRFFDALADGEVDAEP